MAPSKTEAVHEKPATETDIKAATSTVTSCCPHAADIEHDGTDLSQAKNPSLQVTADHKIKMVDAPISKPGRGEVLLHIKATGICG
jgi:hypothetical protein